MKTIINLIFLTALLFFVESKIQAQDRILLKANRDTLMVKVLEVGTDEIKYKLWPVDESMPVMVERKDRIKQIIFANGTVMKFFADEFQDPTNYADQRKMAIKIDPFSIILGMTSVAIEQSIKPGKSWEVGVGIIGLGKLDIDLHQSGLLVRAGYKFINTPDYYMKGMRYTHILKGSYIRPELVASFFNYSQQNYYRNYTSSNTFWHEDKFRRNSYAFMLNFGKQYVFDDIFVVDGFVGLGVGYTNYNAIDVGHDIGSPQFGSVPIYYSDVSKNYGMAFASNDKLTFAIQAGLKVGILIGKKKKDL